MPTAVDPELERHRRTWIGVYLVRQNPRCSTVVVILILMALFLL